MGCLKCGCEVSSGSFFCDTCAADMAAYPVKPGTPIQIPVREAPEKRVIRREPTAAEQLAKLRRVIRGLYWVLALLALLLCILGLLLIHTLDKPPETPEIGKNYTAITTDRP